MLYSTLSENLQKQSSIETLKKTEGRENPKIHNILQQKFRIGSTAKIWFILLI